MLSFIILTWNSEKYLRECFNSITQKCLADSVEWEIIVIDNGSTDSTRQMCHEYAGNSPEHFRIEKLPFNHGTTVTRNIGLRLSKGEYICIMDSDTELAEGSLADVLSLLNTDGSIGIIAPRLILPGGAVQHSIKPFPTLFQKLAKVHSLLLGRPPATRDRYDNFPFNTPKEVDSAISACWFFRRELLDKVGFLDEKIFYAPEDLDYCLRIHKDGLKVLYYPDFQVLHHTQQVTHRSPFSRVAVSHLWGLLYYYRKHGGWITKPKVN